MPNRIKTEESHVLFVRKTAFTDVKTRRMIPFTLLYHKETPLTSISFQISSK